MKKTLLFSALILFSISATFGAVITVMVSNFQFSPKRVNAVVGDQIRWMRVNGSHTTTSTNIPNGAAAWDANINAGNNQFTYTVTTTGTYRYICTPHQAMGMRGRIVVSASLAASLYDFAIEVSEDNKAIINWKATNNKDITYYSVQRSTDGDNFTEVAKLKPAGNVATQSYRYADNTVRADKFTYYMIEMIDKKGNSQLSAIKMFTQQTKTAKLITNLSPNPISSPGHLMMQFNSDKEGAMLVKLYNQSGSLIKQTEMTAVRGLNNGHFHLGDLAPGTYYIVATLGDIQEKHSIIMK